LPHKNAAVCKTTLRIFYSTYHINAIFTAADDSVNLL
jgi:hypothetical protein